MEHKDVVVGLTNLLKQFLFVAHKCILFGIVSGLRRNHCDWLGVGVFKIIYSFGGSQVRSVYCGDFGFNRLIKCLQLLQLFKNVFLIHGKIRVRCVVFSLAVAVSTDHRSLSQTVLELGYM